MVTRIHTIPHTEPPADERVAASDHADSRTRERVLAVAEATFAEGGFHGARLHEIARRAGLRKASLFHHFASKEDLYRAVVDRGASETEQTLRDVLEREGDPQAKVEELLATYVDMVAAHPERTRILLRQSLDGSPVVAQSLETHQLLYSLVQFIAAGQRRHVFLPIDAEALLLGLIGTVAFLFTSASVLATEWPATIDPATVERVKRHVGEVARRCLIPAGGDSLGGKTT
jgi:TetR/AcrR family transcriptional regulator